MTHETGQQSGHGHAGHGHGHGHGEPTSINPEGITDPTEFWEARYLSNRRESGQVWSGRVNAALVSEIGDAASGTALDLGCGEGGDALWLATKGWTVTAVDISSNALAVGEAKAAARGLADRITWVRADLSTWHATTEFDLVSAVFLHSPVELPRDEILRRALSAVTPGGQLLVVGHAAFPPWSSHTEEDTPALPTPDEVLASLELPDTWTVETNALVQREATSPNGETFTLDDAVLRVRRPK